MEMLVESINRWSNWRAPAEKHDLKTERFFPRFYPVDWGSHAVFQFYFRTMLRYEKLISHGREQRKIRFVIYFC